MFRPLVIVALLLAAEGVHQNATAALVPGSPLYTLLERTQPAQDHVAAIAAIAGVQAVGTMSPPAALAKMVEVLKGTEWQYRIFNTDDQIHTLTAVKEGFYVKSKVPVVPHHPCFFNEICSLGLTLENGAWSAVRFPVALANGGKPVAEGLVQEGPAAYRYTFDGPASASIYAVGLAWSEVSFYRTGNKVGTYYLSGSTSDRNTLPVGPDFLTLLAIDNLKLQPDILPLDEEFI